MQRAPLPNYGSLSRGTIPTILRGEGNGTESRNPL